jgi:hypothetical protein
VLRATITETSFSNGTNFSKMHSLCDASSFAAAKSASERKTICPLPSYPPIVVFKTLGYETFFSKSSALSTKQKSATRILIPEIAVFSLKRCWLTFKTSLPCGKYAFASNHANAS